MRLAVNQNHHHQRQQQQNSARHPHYENIYESIEQFATVNAPAPADNPQAQAQAQTSAAPFNQNSANRRLNNLRTRNHFHYHNANASHSHPRNATLAYDVPRAARANYYATNAMGTVNRRATLESNMSNRVRYANANRVAAAAALRQRSFDDTESYHYSRNNTNPNGPFRYENVYEQIREIREEPIYRNIGLGRDSAANQLYGRLDVIGHGIGRIERHLSSSCGNIDHYNLGGTYAHVVHSHLSTHVYASNSAKETAGKSLNLFSCLGRENSQSMSNICRETNGTAQEEAGAAPEASASTSAATNAVATTSTANAAAVAIPPSTENPSNSKHSTGAIPKKKSKAKVQNSMCSSSAGATAAATAVSTTATIPNPAHSSALNRISKSSLQWLLMNKWLPLWIGNGPDCNVLDFNFMFSRNCDGCENEYNDSNGDAGAAAAYANGYRDFGPENYYYSTLSSSSPSPRPRCYHNSLMRFNDSQLRRAYASNGRRWPNYQRTNEMDYNSMRYDANELPYNYCASPPPPPENPFRQWELNSENNSFRPANVRRITDGTYPYPNVGYYQQQQREHQQLQSVANPMPIGNATAQEVRLEINNQPFVEVSSSAPSTSNSTPSTSRAATASTSNAKLKNGHNESSSASSSKSQLRLQAFESGALSSSTESASETENKVRSPECRRYSENTEDDQYNNSTGSSSSTDDDGDGGVGEGDDDENDDTISELHTIDTTDNSERN